MQELEKYTAFEGQHRLASGELKEVVQHIKSHFRTVGAPPVLIFDNSTSRPIDVDFRGTIEEVLNRLASGQTTSPSAETAEIAKPGRPKLGVVAREVTLLPRHWDWLATQPGGASVTLRKLVEAEKRKSQSADQTRQAMESVDRFMRVMGGDLPNYEEASRALYRKEQPRFEALISDWPVDIRDHVRKLAAPVFAGDNS